jgi:hypothetical protein
MKGSDFDESGFFRAVSGSKARALLIGRRALVLLGLPVLTVDYDFWVHIEDIEAFNAAAEPFGLLPSHSPTEARGRGRYVLQNDEIVDVMVARSVTTVLGARIEFDGLWERRNSVTIEPGVTVALPSLPDLISTKRFAARPRDAEDIRLLEALKARSAR